MNFPDKRKKKSLADRLMWGAVAAFAAGFVLPIFWFLPLAIYPTALVVGISELHKERTRKSPRWRHYFLSPLYASVTGALHVLLLTDLAFHEQSLLPLFYSTVISWPVVWTVSRLFFMRSQGLFRRQDPKSDDLDRQ